MGEIAHLYARSSQSSVFLTMWLAINCVGPSAQTQSGRAPLGSVGTDPFLDHFKGPGNFVLQIRELSG